LKLLFDANLSPKPVVRLAELFPGSAHVYHTGLDRVTSDFTIWRYARANGYTIVTADSDFLALADEYGAPPHVVRLENCNYKTAKLEAVLRRHAIRIAELENGSKPALTVRTGE
jgi:predicted nuclease of predicted toxin-antitoxin system